MSNDWSLAVISFCLVPTRLSDASARRLLPFRDVAGNLDFDLGPLVDQPADIEQRRRREIPPQGFLPGSPNAGARGFVFAAAGEIPGQAHDVIRPRAGLGPQLH